jgi:glycine betaine/proline transport system permease protein
MNYFLEFPELSKGVIRAIKKSIDTSFREFSRSYGDSIEVIFYPLKFFMNWVEFALVSAPWPLTMLLFVGVIFYFTRDKILCAGSILYMLFIGVFGLWEDTMYTLSLVIASGLLSVAIGIPIGIWMSRTIRVQNAINPILDVMQTIPIFVYLIPVVMLFGLGKIPGVIAMTIYAVPPIIRLTNLGLRQVGIGMIEAAMSMGMKPWQILWTIELPLSKKSILAGANQTTMMSISMVVIASMIGVQGLGVPVLQAVQNQYIGSGLIAGTAIVGLAIILDRVIQNTK